MGRPLGTYFRTRTFRSQYGDVVVEVAGAFMKLICTQRALAGSSAQPALALLLIAQRLALHAQAQADAARAQRRDAHLQVERGNPHRVFRGERFEPAAD